MLAWSEWLIGHGLSPPGKNKKPEPITAPALGVSLAPALKALALFDVHDEFGLTVPTVDHEIFRVGVRTDFKQMLVPLADRANQIA